jgi:hypothetical protein
MNIVNTAFIIIIITIILDLFWPSYCSFIHILHGSVNPEQARIFHRYKNTQKFCLSLMQQSYLIKMCR